MVERAVSLFRSRQANCAQSVAQAWREKTGQDRQANEPLSGYGHGRCPDGTCGALYAAKLIAGPERAAQIELVFTQASGGLTTCRDIRAGRVMACADCVSTAAKALSEQLISQDTP